MQTVDWDGEQVQVPTEEELLAFVNRVRSVTGQDPLPALLPSDQSSPNSCLIANGVNHGIQVDAKNSDEWYMEGGGFSADDWERIADELDLTVYDDYTGVANGVWLPSEIGLAAEAFDEGYAYQSLAVHQ